MPNLQPYENPSYFIALGLGLILIIVGLYFGKRFRWYENIFSLIFLFLAFDGTHSSQAVALCAYIVFETVLIRIYLSLRINYNYAWMIYAAVILSILPLVIVKVTPAINNGHNSLLGFLGISYITFKVVGMLMEIRDGMIKEFSFNKILHFLLFFPTISSGPIDRYRRFVKDYQTVPAQKEYVKMLDKGIWKIMLGFLYKFLLAYFFGSFLLPMVSKEALFQRGLSWYLLAYMYVYAMYLFFDFAGYSLFAIGTSYLMGIKTPDNFNRPFISANIKEFWQRWHMTLSFWFRDYIYMRLVFTLMKKKVFKSQVVTANAGYLTLFIIMGFWHGLTWYYIVYGLFHASAMIICDWWQRFKKKHRSDIPSNRVTKCCAIAITFNLVCFSFLIFSGFLNQLFFS